MSVTVLTASLPVPRSELSLLQPSRLLHKGVSTAWVLLVQTTGSSRVLFTTCSQQGLEAWGASCNCQHVTMIATQTLLLSCTTAVIAAVECATLPTLQLSICLDHLPDPVAATPHTHSSGSNSTHTAVAAAACTPVEIQRQQPTAAHHTSSTTFTVSCVSRRICLEIPFPKQTPSPCRLLHPSLASPPPLAPPFPLTSY